MLKGIIEVSEISKRKGFTLVELLVVMAILVILFALVLVAINPVRQIQQANNTKRRSNVNTIVNATNQYAADHAGVLPIGVITTLRIIGTSAGACDTTICAGEFPSASCLDLGGMITPRYIASMPYDPTTGTAANTRYAIKTSASESRITVKACDAELSETISVTQ